MVALVWRERWYVSLLNDTRFPFELSPDIYFVFALGFVKIAQNLKDVSVLNDTRFSFEIFTNIFLSLRLVVEISPLEYFVHGRVCGNIAINP